MQRKEKLVSAREKDFLLDAPRRRRKPRLRGAGACLDAVDACRAELPDIYAALLRKKRRRQQLEKLRELYDGRYGWALA